MKNTNTQKLDTFEAQLSKFKKLLTGAKMAKASSFILIIVSLKFVYTSRDNAVNVMLLLIGVLAMVFFIDKFLSLKEIKQKAYTQTSLISSISKLKSYMLKRKKYEMYFMTFWLLTLIPSAATYFESNVLGAAGVILYIAIVGVFGNLAYRKTDKEISLLERTMENELSHY